MITAGVAPAASDEVALGASTMRDAHTAIGRTVDIVLDPAARHPRPTRMRVVGTVIVPPNPFQGTQLGEGAALALPGFARTDPGAAAQLGTLPFLVRFAPGVGRDAGLTAIAHDIKGLPNPFVAAAERPANVVSLAAIAGLPVALSGLLALIAAGTLAHTLASSTRRRRRDLAVLKTLGFVRAQLRATVAWQASTLTAVAASIGLVGGIIGGRLVWTFFAGRLGIRAEPAIPLLLLIVIIPAALVLWNVIAAFPARAAARTEAAVVLRTE